MAKTIHSSDGILIVDCNGIGDIVVNLSLYAALRDLFPGEQITLMGHPWALSLLRYTGLVNSYITVQVPWKHGEGKYLSGSLIKSFRTAWEQRGKFRLGVEFSGDCRNKFLLWLTGASRRVGLSYASVSSGPMSGLIPFRYLPGDRLLTDSIPVQNNWTHVLNQRAQCIKYLGFQKTLQQPKLKVNQHELDKTFKQFPKHDKIVLVHPGAGSPLRNWPAENHVVLIKGLINRGFTPVLVGGPKEKQIIEAIVGLLGNCQISIMWPSLRGFIALVAVSRCVVCMDSAAAHLAGNLNIPAIVLYGPQSRSLWQPVSGPVALLRNEVCDEHPCIGRSCSRGIPTPCMLSITSFQVLEAFDHLMHNNQRKIFDDNDRKSKGRIYKRDRT